MKNYSEALPQTDKWRNISLSCLDEAMLVAGCSILDKTKKEPFLITSSIQEPAYSICSQMALQHIET
jgi:hypothetical protein